MAISHSERKHVLVTGATGFIATHIIEMLVEAKYKVTATTRDASASKTGKLYADFPAYKGNVTFISVPDFTVPGAFDHAFQGEPFDYILHTASPIPMVSDDVVRDLIDPAIKGTTILLKAAHELGGSSLKRFVLTSSGVTVIDTFRDKGDARAEKWTEADWSPVTVEAAVEAKHPGLAYMASKTIGEKSAWEFMASAKPTYDLTTLLPVIVLGPNLNPVPSADKVEQGAATHVYAFFNGTHKTTENVEYIFYDHIDVRDVALAHVLSMTAPAASNQRIALCSTDPLTPQRVVNILNKNFPELEDRIATGNPEDDYPVGVHPTLWNTQKAHDVFGAGWRFRNVEESVVDLTKQLLEQEKKF
ncbi:hypothetical protein B0A49_04407 [Cryomyces minteri]|uniref:NAD-dependent epimerase/dehydratase domain-containing protein n=1 Tax=Cryomyces minteri TaxID=331657 RepID=A0A4U0WU98_9PEZI|nr:hypothetical protein B0A49_06044 [Cryomyces minteri]TKA70366.1 hypothetical protein B0A49_04407 [Cryomyces minteri]